VIDAVKSGHRVEDCRVELKSDWSSDMPVEGGVCAKTDERGYWIVATYQRRAAIRILDKWRGQQSNEPLPHLNPSESPALREAKALNSGS
jgi:hypothetical protein